MAEWRWVGAKDWVAGGFVGVLSFSIQISRRHTEPDGLFRLCLSGATHEAETNQNLLSDGYS